MQHHAAVNQWWAYRLGGERPERRDETRGRKRWRWDSFDCRSPPVLLAFHTPDSVLPLLANSRPVQRSNHLNRSIRLARPSNWSNRAPSEAGGGALIRSSTPVICSLARAAKLNHPRASPPCAGLVVTSIHPPFFSSPLLSFSLACAAALLSSHFCSCFILLNCKPACRVGP
jgi:hypothetical protein